MLPSQGVANGENDIIAYHLRISFKPDEADAETAGRIAYDLALKLTKNNHAYVCSVHDDKAHIHAHVIINSTSLDCCRKFRNFYNSSFHIRKIADHLCLENGLSVIENPQQASKGKGYGEWLGDNKPPVVREQLQDIIDKITPKCKNYDDFINALQAKNVEIKSGKQLSFKLPTAKRFVRHDTLGDDYSMTAILEKMSGQRTIAPRQKFATPASINKPNLLIDIQTKMQQGYGSGSGFERFATIQNIKEMSKTLLFLKDRGLDNYDLLTAKADEFTRKFNKRSARVKTIESRQKDISELQRHIGTYGKTRDIYAEYKRLKKIKPSAIQKFINSTHPADEFYEANRADITLHEVAKKHFDSLGIQKLPSITDLKSEYTSLNAEKKKLYSGYKEEREEMIALKMAKQNADIILGKALLSQKNRAHEPSL